MALPDLQLSQLTEEAKGLTTITFRWPDPTGCLVDPLLKDLEKILAYLEDEAGSSVVVFRGLGSEKGSANDARSWRPDIDHCRRWERLLVRIDRLAGVTVASIDGTCVRFPLQLAIACDYRIASRRTTFQMPELKEGYLPGMGIFRLSKFIGLGHARRAILTGDPFGPADAWTQGLIDRVCDQSELASTERQLVEGLVPLDRMVVQMARRLLNESFSTSFEDAMGHFLAAQHRCLSGPRPEVGVPFPTRHSDDLPPR